MTLGLQKVYIRGGFERGVQAVFKRKVYEGFTFRRSGGLRGVINGILGPLESFYGQSGGLLRAVAGKCSNGAQTGFKRRGCSGRPESLGKAEKVR